MKNLKKRISLILAVIMMTTFMPVWAAENARLELTEFIGATFEENINSVGADANNGYGGSYSMQVCEGTGGVTFANDPANSGRSVCVSAVMPAEKSKPYSASFAPTAIRNTKNLINAENLLYMSTDVYLSNTFENKVNVIFSTSAATATIAAVTFEKDNKLVVTYNGGSVTTNIDTKAERWYTIGVLQDKTNNKISYFIDNVPVEGGANLDGWCGEGTDFGMIRASKNAELTSAYNIYFDNIYVYNVVESSINAEVEESITLPSAVVIKNLLNGNTETKNIAWDECSTDIEGKFKVFGKVADKNLFVPAVITVSDPYKGNEEIAINIKEIMNAHFNADAYTVGASAENSYWAGSRLLIKNRQNNNVKFVADPKREGLAISSDLNPNEQFSAYLELMKTYKDETKDADFLYASTDVYFPNDFAGEFELRFESELGGKKVGSVKFAADGAIQAVQNSSDVITIGQTEKEKWYTVGVLVDKVNSKISYYLDGALVKKANDLTGWAVEGDGIGYVAGYIRSQPTAKYTIYFDNITAYSIPKYDVNGLENEEIMAKMPGKANISKTVITNKGSWSFTDTTVTETIRWNTDTFKQTTAGTYFAKAKTASSGIPVLTKVTVSDPYKGNEEIAINIKEIMNAHFNADAYKVGDPAADSYWAGNRLLIKNWQNNNVKFVADPEREGLAISSDLNPNEYFSAYLELMGTYKNETKNADLLYVSTDVYFPSDFTGEFELRFDSELNNAHIGVVRFDADGNIRAVQNADEDIEEIVIGQTEKEKWYTVGILVDKVNSKISYYLDGALVENAKDLPGWAGKGDGFAYVSGSIDSEKPTEKYTMYYDNVLAYSIPEYAVNGLENEEIMAKMPGKANISKTVITNKGSWSFTDTTVTETIRWNTDTFDQTTAGTYFAKAKTDSSGIPVLTKVIVVGEGFVDADGVAVNSLNNYNGSLYLSIVDARDGLKAFIAIYDSNKMLLEARVATVTDGKANVGFETLPANVAFAKGFLWDDMIPVEKYEISSTLELYVSANAVENGDGSLQSPFATVYDAKDYVRNLSSEEKADGVNVNF